MLLSINVGGIFADYIRGIESLLSVKVNKTKQNHDRLSFSPAGRKFEKNKV